MLEAAGPAMDKAAEVAPLDQRPDDLTLVKIDAGVKIVAGTMLAFGKFPRLASTALAASLIPTTLAGHRFWEEDDPEVRSAAADPLPEERRSARRPAHRVGRHARQAVDRLAGPEGSGAAVGPDVDPRGFGRRADRAAGGRGVGRVDAGRRGDAGGRRPGR